MPQKETMFKRASIPITPVSGPIIEVKMESLLIALGAFSCGVYFAEPVRKTIPILDPGAKS